MNKIYYGYWVYVCSIENGRSGRESIKYTRVKNGFEIYRH